MHAQMHTSRQAETCCSLRHNPCKVACKIIAGTIARPLQSSGLPRNPRFLIRRHKAAHGSVFF
jgi:hypothetical protein